MGFLILCCCFTKRNLQPMEDSSLDYSSYIWSSVDVFERSVCLKEQGIKGHQIKGKEKNRYQSVPIKSTIKIIKTDMQTAGEENMEEHLYGEGIDEHRYEEEGSEEHHYEEGGIEEHHYEEVY